MNIKESVDITPNPKVLRVLGDIPFEFWQCIAELMDNSFDAFRVAEQSGNPIQNPRVTVTWSSDNVAASDREITFRDNGPGMTLDTLEKAARAGYSSNDPVNNLGLFGMGFNIATAKLGEETLFWSTRKGDDKWIGIRINFDELIKSESFKAPTIVREKDDPDESGTIITIRKLKTGVLSDIQKRLRSIRSRLERIYTPILSEGKIQVMIQGCGLLPRPLCVWDKSRFVTRAGVEVHAVQDIDIPLGMSYFDASRNRYLSPEEYDNLTEDERSEITQREQRMHGWIGVQRFGDTSDYGIDYIRNGRKILIADKRVFQFENPDTGVVISEYPQDLGSTYGGRIVGEITVDYLIPTYQKNDFLPSGTGWKRTYEALRGDGPLVRKNRQALGFDGVSTSILGTMISAYRRPEAGTHNLCILNTVAKQFAAEFFRRTPEYLTDEKWFAAAQDADRQKHDQSDENVDQGSVSTTDIDSYLEDDTGDSDSSGDESSTLKAAETNARIASAEVGVVQAAPSNQDSEENDLVSKSILESTYSGDYSCKGCGTKVKVLVYRMVSGEIRKSDEKVPCVIFKDGINVKFFYDPTNPVIAQYPITPKRLLLLCLSEIFVHREAGLSVLDAFLGLLDANLGDERINVALLRERADSMIRSIKEQLPELLKDKFLEVKEVIKKDSIDESMFFRALVRSAPALYDEYQLGNSSTGKEAFAYVPDTTVVRLVESFPEVFLDSKVFKQPYSKISIQGDEALTNDLRRQSLERVTSYLRDLVALLAGAQETSRAMAKQELIRYSNSIELLDKMSV